jgi:hypothetical protein
MNSISLALFILFALALAAASETGFRFGRKAASRAIGKRTPPLGAIQGGVLALLGLLLGFTMSMAVARFEARKQLVLEEANAIGASHLRTRLLPDPERTRIANLLRDYVEVRLRNADVRDDLNRLQANREQGARLQNELWSQAVFYAMKDPNPVRAGLLLQSLNQVIDLEAARWMALQNQVPPAVIYVNVIVALAATNLMGFASAFEGRRQVFATSVLALTITVVLGVIEDLDKPRQGFMQVSQQPLIDLSRQLSKLNQ